MLSKRTVCTRLDFSTINWHLGLTSFFSKVTCVCESLEGDVVMMDKRLHSKSATRRVRSEGHRGCTSRARMWNASGCTAKCQGWAPMLKGTVKAKVAELRTKKFLDRAAEKGTKRARSALEQGGHDEALTSERMAAGGEIHRTRVRAAAAAQERE